MSTLSAAADQLRHTLTSQPNWQEMYRLLLQNAKQAPVLPEEARTAACQVHGCEANVYLALSGTQQAVHFHFYSDARMVHALIHTALLPLQGQSAAYISAFDVQAWLRSCQLDQQLSPSRSNGLFQVIKAAKARAQQLPK